jgi:hypothetical protein
MEKISVGDLMMNQKVKDQILAIRHTGLTNMFDVSKVQKLAFDLELYDLVTFIEEHKADYIQFILHGDR